jgi:hypothetical protein
MFRSSFTTWWRRSRRASRSMRNGSISSATLPARFTRSGWASSNRSTLPPWPLTPAS